MSQKKQEVQEAQANALPAGLDFGADAGAGMEGADKDSFAIPFLRALQKISPEVDEADAKFIEGAKGGQLFNSVTQKLYDGKTGIIFIPCAYQRRFLRWAPRGSEGGYKGEYRPEEVAAMRERGEVVQIEGEGLFIADEDGNANAKKNDRLADTRSHFGLTYDPETGETQQVLLALSSTQIKKSKQLMSMLNNVKVKNASGSMVTPPTWVNQIRLTTVLESNSEGSWYGLKVEGEGFIPNQDVYDKGKAFHEAVAAGEAKANFAEEETAGEAKGEGEGKF